MIDVIAQTPIEYSKQSRDYQVIARLYTALFNINKMYIDDMSVWDANIDNKLSHLRAKTLNFHPKHAWDYDSLDATVSCLKYWIRHKGTRKAIEEVMEILIRINNLKGKPVVEVDYETYTIIIKVPYNLASLGVVEDVLELIIPIGMGYRIIYYLSVSDDILDRLAIKDNIDVKKNVKFIPTYKMGVGGPRMGEVGSEVGYSSLHVAPGLFYTDQFTNTIIEAGMDSGNLGASIWPDDTNESQGALVNYNIVTTMGEVRDSHGPEGGAGTKGGEHYQDETSDTNIGEDDIKWQKKK